MSGSPFQDVVGNMSPFAETVGGGRAVVLREGLSFEARWSRPAPEVGTAYTTPAGEPIPFAPGQVWIVLNPLRPGSASGFRGYFWMWWCRAVFGRAGAVEAVKRRDGCVAGAISRETRHDCRRATVHWAAERISNIMHSNQKHHECVLHL
ncbi:DUF3048 C-terminal domain-containing protein [Saccharopolyspora sp. NPDC000995]